MKRIEKLTPEQEATMPQWAEKWIKIGLQTGETDWDTFMKYMPICYEKAGLKFPTNVVRVSSPIVGGLAASIANKILKDKGSDAVRDAVGDAVRDAVGDAVDDAVRGAKLQWHYWLGGQFWVGGWYYGSPSYVSFFTDVCNLELTKDIKERAEAYRKVCESVNYIWCNSHFVMVCARPKAIHRNARGQLHNENGKAIEYPDGWGLYALNGVRFPEDLFKKITSKRMTFEAVMGIVDVDQRTQALKFVDFKKFAQHAKAEVIDTYTKMKFDGTPITYTLYNFPKGEIFQTDEHIVHFNCPSTGNEYMHGVEKDWGKTVPEVMAQMFSNPEQGLVCTADEWSRLVPLTDES